MNRNHLVLILSRFKLSRLKQNPQKVYGGLLHTMWRIETTTGVYAIKQLSTDIDLKNKNIVDNYNLTEEIARRFIDKGISGISAIKASGQYLLISSGVGFLVYPWVDAKMLDRDAISLRHAIKIAEFLSKDASH